MADAWFSTSLQVRRGEGLDLVPLGVGLPADGRVELFLPAEDLLLLDPDLDRLLLQLVRHVGVGLLQVRFALLFGDGLRRLEVRDLGRPPRGRLRFRLAPVLVRLCFSDRGVALGLGLLRELLRFRLPFPRLALRIGLRDHRLLGRDGFGDGRGALYFRDARFSEGLEIAVLVADIADGEGVDSEAHVREVPGGDLLHLLRELIAVLVDVLDAERAQDRPQVALHRFERDLGDLLGRFSEEALGGGMKRSLVFLDLDLGDTVHQDGNALRRVHLGRRDVESHHFEREAVPGMEQRNHHVRASGDELHPSAAGDHDDLVRPRLLEKGEVGEDVPHDRDGDDRESGQQEYVSENELH